MVLFEDCDVDCCVSGTAKSFVATSMNGVVESVGISPREGHTGSLYSTNILCVNSSDNDRASETRYYDDYVIPIP